MHTLLKLLKALPAIVLIGIIAVFGTLAVSAQNTKTPALTEVSQMDAPVQAVMFYSSWCAACQILDPKINAVAPAFVNRQVEFITFNFSFSMFKKDALLGLAREYDLEKIYTANKGKTGFMLLVEPQSQRVLDVIMAGDSAMQIASKLDQALQRNYPGP